MKITINNTREYRAFVLENNPDIEVGKRYNWDSMFENDEIVLDTIEMFRDGYRVTLESGEVVRLEKDGSEVARVNLNNLFKVDFSVDTAKVTESMHAFCNTMNTQVPKTNHVDYKALARKAYYEHSCFGWDGQRKVFDDFGSKYGVTFMYMGDCLKCMDGLVVLGAWMVSELR